MDSKQTAMVAAKARTDNSKSPAVRARRDAAQAELIAKLQAFEEMHRAELAAGDPATIAAYRELKWGRAA